LYIIVSKYSAVVGTNMGTLRYV